VFLHQSQMSSISSELAARDNMDISTLSRILPPPSESQVRGIVGVSTQNQGDRLLILAARNDHEVPAHHQELVRVLEIPLSLDMVVVTEGEQVSAASVSRVVSSPPIDELATRRVIGASVEARVEGNPGTQRRETVLQGSSRVPPGTSPKG